MTYTVKFLNESFELGRARTSMTLYAPSTCALGSSIKIKGRLEPAMANVPIEILVESPLGKQISYTALTDALGCFEVSFVADENGTWIVRASWRGNAFYGESQARAEVVVASGATEDFLTPPRGPEEQARPIVALDLGLLAAICVIVC